MNDVEMEALMNDLDEGTVDDFLKNWIFYEKRVVTSKHLSARFKMSPEIARRHMQRFYDLHANDPKRKICSVFYISGIIDKDGVEVYKAGLCRGKDLDEVKDRFTEVISSHIFSLQTADIKDVATVLLADDLDGKQTDCRMNPPITCVNAKRRSISPDISTPSDSGSMKAEPRQKQEKSESTEPKSKYFPEEKQETTTNKSTDVGSTKQKRPTTSKDDANSKKQARLTSFFKKS